MINPYTPYCFFSVQSFLHLLKDIFERSGRGWGGEGSLDSIQNMISTINGLGRILIIHFTTDCSERIVHHLSPFIFLII